MPLTRLLTAAGCAALLAGAAHAQTTTETTIETTTETTTVVNPDTGETRTIQYTISGDADARAAAAAQLGVDAGALVLAPDRPAGTVSTELVTNGPVPDTAENRAQYGGPNSRAGKMTDPAGN